ncbi:MAG: outer membrane beta-barrel protein [Gammaproteobacteria bacterium]|jgi:hypothetical protein
MLAKPVNTLVFAALMLCSFATSAFDFEPGVGVGLEYTDNATLAADNPVDDLIAIGYLGATLQDDDGPVTADVTAALNYHNYTKDTFENQRYFNLNAVVDWAMIQNRFDWLLRDFYRQRPIDTTDPNTPDNIQDSNILVFGANMVFPVTARQTINVLPEYRNFYYENQFTDNQQLALMASWDYSLSPLTAVGVKGHIRTVDFDERAVDNVSFASIFYTIAHQRVRSDFSANLGVTGVERDNGQNTEELAGYLDWLFNLTQRSRFRAFLSTDLTDTSSDALRGTVDPGTGDPNEIQITTDVIRNKVISLGYTHEISKLASSLTGQYRELNYSETPNDRTIWSLQAVFNYPVAAALTSGFYARYNNTDFTDTVRTDDNTTVGVNASYRLTPRLNGLVDLKYRNRDSTQATQNFDDWSAYVSLVYGFGQPLQPTRAGGF